MRVLFVIRDAYGWAGTERVLSLIAGGLSARHDVQVLSLEPKPETARGYDYGTAVAIASIPVRGGAAGLLASNLDTTRFLKAGAFDIVILAGVGEIKHVLLAALGRRTWRLVAWEHFNVALTHRRINRRVAARLCDTIVPLTEKDAADWKRLLRPRGTVVPIPNPIPSYPDRPSTLEAKRILALGRMEDQKRFDLLLQAFASFSTARPGWSLRIRGSGSREADLRTLAGTLGIAGRVEILPPTSDVAGEYRAASMYAMSSDYEGFPMTLLEAMAHGLPCVSFDCPNGPSDIIQDGEDGFLVPLHDTGALAERLGSLADDTGLRRAMGAKARDNIRRYGMAPIMDRWHRLIGTP